MDLQTKRKLMEINQTELKFSFFILIRTVEEDLWDNINHTNILYYRGPRRKCKERAKNVFEAIVAENFPNSETEIDIQVQEALA